MSQDAQNIYRKAAELVGSGRLTNQFGATGIAFEDAPENSPTPSHEITGFQGDAKTTLYNLQSDERGQALQASINVGVESQLTAGQKEKNKNRDAAYLLHLQQIQESIQRYNESISKILDQYGDMAEWYKDQAQKASDSMGAIAERMAKNGDFINGTNEIFDGYKKTGELDREKARRLLLERGINTDGKVTNDQLMELLRREQLRVISNSNELSERYEEQKNRKERFEEAQAEIEAKAKELRQRRDEINNSNKPPEEIELLLKDLDEEYGFDVRNRAVKLESDEKKAQKEDVTLQKAFRSKAPEKTEAIEAIDAFDVLDSPMASVMQSSFKVAASGEKPQIGESEFKANPEDLNPSRFSKNPGL